MLMRMAMLKLVTKQDVTSGMAGSLIATRRMTTSETARKLISEKQCG
jgi:hypothetical protein